MLMFGTLGGKKKDISRKSSTADGIIKQSSNGLPTIYWTDEKSILTLKEKEGSIALEQAVKFLKFNRLHFLFIPLFSWLRIFNNSERGQNLRKIFTLTVDSACWSPLVATHLYTPASSVPALYKVRMDDDSSLRVTVMSGLFCSILSPLGPNQSMCLATPATENTENNNIVNEVSTLYASTVFTGTGMDAVYAWARTDA